VTPSLAIALSYRGCSIVIGVGQWRSIAINSAIHGDSQGSRRSDFQWFFGSARGDRPTIANLTTLLSKSLESEKNLQIATNCHIL
jgi:hypothetical protein